MMTYRQEEFRSIKLISDTKQSVTIAEDTDDYVLYELDLGTAKGTHNMTQYIDLIGQHLDSTVLGTRDILIVGWIIGEDLAEINRRKILLDKLVNPMYMVRLEYNKYAIDFKPDSSIQYSTAWEENNAYMCKFQIQGTAPVPVFSLKDYKTFRQTVEQTSDFHFPLVIPKREGVKFGYFPLESVRNMPNDGDVESGMLITLTAEGAAAVNPRIVNETTGAKIEFEYTLDTGDSLIINTELGKQYVTLLQGSIRTNAIKYITIDSDIDMTLSLGFNKLMAYADSGEDELNMEIEFSPRFLEVEGR